MRWPNLLAEHVEIELAQLTVSSDENISAATGGVEECEGLQLFVKRKQLVLVAFGLVKLGVQFVEAQRFEQFEDIGLTGVVRTEFAAAPGGIKRNDGLKHGAKNRWGNGTPIQRAQGQQLLARGAVKFGRPKVRLRQFALSVFRLEAAKIVGRLLVGVAQVFAPATCAPSTGCLSTANQFFPALCPTC